MKTILHKIEPEGILWAVALTALLFLDPTDHSGVSFCLFKILGFTFCPGCGLGHAIAYLYRGEIIDSFYAHPLGIPAFVIISSRCVRLLYKAAVSIKGGQAHAFSMGVPSGSLRSLFRPTDVVSGNQELYEGGTINSVKFKILALRQKLQI